MRAVWQSFLASMQYDPVETGEAYIFVILGITDGGDVHGYMPIKSRYGFVTAQASTRDVAHELGHGVFNLRHTFSEENSFTLQEGDTENLMDYSSGTELWKAPCNLFVVLRHYTIETMQHMSLEVITDENVLVEKCLENNRHAQQLLYEKLCSFIFQLGNM
jgi:hypothetical protein